MARKARSRQRGEVGRAKLFQNGRSQAVRLPKAFRMEGDMVLRTATSGDPKGQMTRPTAHMK